MFSPNLGPYYSFEYDVAETDDPDLEYSGASLEGSVNDLERTVIKSGCDIDFEEFCKYKKANFAEFTELMNRRFAYGQMKYTPKRTEKVLERIVKDVKRYFCPRKYFRKKSLKKVSLYCIYNTSFANSYNSAVAELNSEYCKKKSLVVRAAQVNKSFSTLPLDLREFIFEIFSSLYVFPSDKAFTARIHKEISALRVDKKKMHYEFGTNQEDQDCVIQ